MFARSRDSRLTQVERWRPASPPCATTASYCTLEAMRTQGRFYWFKASQRGTKAPAENSHVVTTDGLRELIAPTQFGVGARFFHFFSTALCFEIVSAEEDSETAAGSRKGRVQFRFNFSRRTRSDCKSMYGVLKCEYGSAPRAARFRNVYRTPYRLTTAPSDERLRIPVDLRCVRVF
jgi:hypothetical protein